MEPIELATLCIKAATLCLISKTLLDIYRDLKKQQDNYRLFIMRLCNYKQEAIDLIEAIENDEYTISHEEDKKTTIYFKNKKEDEE